MAIKIWTRDDVPTSDDFSSMKRNMRKRLNRIAEDPYNAHQHMIGVFDKLEVDLKEKRFANRTDAGKVAIMNRLEKMNAAKTATVKGAKAVIADTAKMLGPKFLELDTDQRSAVFHYVQSNM